MADYIRVKSEHATVFPSVYRRKIPSGKFTSETNFANIPMSVTDKSSYVLEADSTKRLLRFVLYGHYFVLKDLDTEYDFIFGSTNTNLYAAIVLETDTNKEFYNLVNFDNYNAVNTAYDPYSLDDASGNFAGLELFSIKPTDLTNDGCVMEVFQLKTNGVWNYGRLNTDSVLFYNTNTNAEYTLTEELNNKQPTIEEVTEPETFLKDQYSSITVETTKSSDQSPVTYLHVNPLYRYAINSLYETTTSSNKLNYFKDGILTNSKDTIGYGGGTINSIESSSYYYTEAIKLEEGSVVRGTNFYYSTVDPTSVSVSTAKPGDIWFKYK